MALGRLAKLGLKVVALVSRRLEKGVLDGLRTSGVRTIDLDMDVCPAPGMQLNSNAFAAKAITLNIRSDLARLGFDQGVFDDSRQEVEALLARQDTIGLAKLLARIYGGFCPQQYDNELNVEVHERLTAFEIEQQLSELGHSVDDLRIVCAFGTGGTSTVERVKAELSSNGLLYRYRSFDGLGGEEGAFALCSLWLVDNLAKQGRASEAEALFEKILGYSNHLGLFAEEINPETGDLLGNFPQAFTHLNIINSATNLDRAMEREGAT